MLLLISSDRISTYFQISLWRYINPDQERGIDDLFAERKMNDTLTLPNNKGKFAKKVNKTFFSKRHSGNSVSFSDDLIG